MRNYDSPVVVYRAPDGDSPGGLVLPPLAGTSPRPDAEEAGAPPTRRESIESFVRVDTNGEGVCCRTSGGLSLACAGVCVCVCMRMYVCARGPVCMCVFVVPAGLSDVLGSTLPQKTYPVLSPLTVATQAGQIEVVRVLIGHGMDATLVDASGLSSYQRALLQVAVLDTRRRQLSKANWSPPTAAPPPQPAAAASAALLPVPSSAWQGPPADGSLVVDVNMPVRGSAPNTPTARGGGGSIDMGPRARWGAIRGAVRNKEFVEQLKGAEFGQEVLMRSHSGGAGRNSPLQSPTQRQALARKGE